MEIAKVKKDQKVNIPCFVVGGKDGWSLGQAPSDGLLLSLNTLEKQTGGAFISNEILEKNGYSINSEPTLEQILKVSVRYMAQKICNKFTKDDFFSMIAGVVDVDAYDKIPIRTKKIDLAVIYLEGLLK